MSDRSAIEWTDATWNPVRGCTKVSPGCKHCYAETFAERFRGVKGHPYEQGFDLRLVPEKLNEPLHWRRPRRIFVNGMSDLFQEGVPEGYIEACFLTMARAQRLKLGHVFQVLTKRAVPMRDFVRNHRFPNGLTLEERPLPNVWLGVSVEDQPWAQVRVPCLIKTPAAVRFLSCEPLLGPIDLRPWLKRGRCEFPLDRAIDWVIVGGESGPGARPMQKWWVEFLQAQCEMMDTPFFFKQWGGVHKKAAGRTLNGKEYNEYPAQHLSAARSIGA